MVNKQKKMNDDMCMEYFGAVKKLMMVELGELEVDDIQDELMVLRRIRKILPAQILQKKYQVML